MNNNVEKSQKEDNSTRKAIVYKKESRSTFTLDGIPEMYKQKQTSFILLVYKNYFSMKWYIYLPVWRDAFSSSQQTKYE